jgi:nitroreductase
MRRRVGSTPILFRPFSATGEVVVSEGRDALAWLLGRCSVGPKYLGGPAPDEAMLHRMVAAALRAPDHGGLVPFRFVTVASEAERLRLAGLYERAALAAGKDAEGVARERERAQEPPLLVAVIARIDEDHPVAPPHEQWMAVGGAVANFLNAAHMLGYGGKMVSGAKARDPDVAAAFCGPGETLVGWIVLGTPRRTMRPKPGKPEPGALIGPWLPGA